MASVTETFQQALEHHRAGRLGQAEQMYRLVLQNQPRHAGAAHLLGLIAFQVGKRELAEQLVSDAIRVDGFHAPYYADLGEIQRSLDKPTAAIASYRRALELNPETAEAHDRFGTLLYGQGERAQAVECFRRALAFGPKYIHAYVHLGAALLVEGQLDEARATLEKAANLAPENAAVYLALGNAFDVQGDHIGAVACYQKAARLDAQMAAAHYHVALSRLAQGDFANGWAGFEWRLRAVAPRRSFDLPTWDGANLQGGRLLVHAEHDTGDTLQFVRYVRLLALHDVTLAFDVPAHVAPLLAQTSIAPLLVSEPPADCAAQVPLLSVPGLVGTTLATIPTNIPYLASVAEDRERWRQTLAAVPGFRVGIIWQADAGHPHERYRALPLAEFARLAAVPGVRLISLESPLAADLATAADKLGVVHFEALDAAPVSLLELAAIIDNLDLVITCEANAAHLAGGLAAPTWVALSTAADWRWLHDRSDSPWYPTMRLFRQTAPGAWSDVFQRMAAELPKLVAEKRNA